jgi:hypothetical protein
MHQQSFLEDAGQCSSMLEVSRVEDEANASRFSFHLFWINTFLLFATCFFPFLFAEYGYIYFLILILLVWDAGDDRWCGVLTTELSWR